MPLQFLSIDNFERGIVSSLLRRSYAALVVASDPLWRDEPAKFDAYDDEVFLNPATVGSCIFLTESDGVVVGLGSWDPRQRPAFSVVGHNCVLPEFRGRGFGKMQIQEILRRFQRQNVITAKVSTCAYPFFLPARRMYEACGFVEMRRVSGASGRRMVEYEKSLV